LKDVGEYGDGGREEEELYVSLSLCFGVEFVIAGFVREAIFEDLRRDR